MIKSLVYTGPYKEHLWRFKHFRTVQKQKNNYSDRTLHLVSCCNLDTFPTHLLATSHSTLQVWGTVQACVKRSPAWAHRNFGTQNVAENVWWPSGPLWKKRTPTGHLQDKFRPDCAFVTAAHIHVHNMFLQQKEVFTSPAVVMWDCIWLHDFSIFL